MRPAAATSWYEVPLPPPKEVRVHDIITIRVDMGARMTSDAQLQRRRTAQYDAMLNDWIILEGLRAVKPAPQSDGDQRVQGNLNISTACTGELETTESLKFEIAATVAAVLPNGNLVLEAHRTRPQQRRVLDALAVGRLPPRGHRPGQRRPQQGHRQPAKSKSASSARFATATNAAG